jgi:hypothetical protein
VWKIWDWLFLSPPCPSAEVRHRPHICLLLRCVGHCCALHPKRLNAVHGVKPGLKIKNHSPGPIRCCSICPSTSALEGENSQGRLLAARSLAYLIHVQMFDELATLACSILFRLMCCPCCWKPNVTRLDRHVSHLQFPHKDHVDALVARPITHEFLENHFIIILPQVYGLSPPYSTTTFCSQASITSQGTKLHVHAYKQIWAVAKIARDDRLLSVVS